MMQKSAAPQIPKKFIPVAGGMQSLRLVNLQDASASDQAKDVDRRAVKDSSDSDSSATDDSNSDISDASGSQLTNYLPAKATATTKKKAKMAAATTMAAAGGDLDLASGQSTSDADTGVGSSVPSVDDSSQLCKQ